MPRQKSPERNPDSSRTEKSFLGRLFEKAEDKKKESAEKRKACSCPCKIEEADWHTPEEKKFLEAEKITEEKLSFALFAINNALCFINSNPAVSKEIKKRGIKIKPASYYLAIAFHESKLKPESIANNGEDTHPDKYALGYFQLKKAAMLDVNTNFSTNFSRSKMFSEKEINSPEQSRASIDNATIGILYWHLCEERFQAPMAKTMAQEDRDKFTSLIYYLGSSGFHSLYKALDSPKTFEEFGEKAAKHLAENVEFVSERKHGLITTFERSFFVEIRSYIDTGEMRTKEAMEKLKRKTIKIKGYKISAFNLLEVVRYGEISHGLMQAKTLKEPETLSYKVAPKENAYEIAKNLLPKYGIKIKDKKLEERLAWALVPAINGGNILIGKDQVIKVPSKEGAFKRLYEKGIIHIVEKGDGMNKIAKKIIEKHDIEIKKRSDVSKLADFLISYNKKVNASYSKKLIPGIPVYIPKKDELERAIV